MPLPIQAFLRLLRMNKAPLTIGGALGAMGSMKTTSAFRPPMVSQQGWDESGFSPFSSPANQSAGKSDYSTPVSDEYARGGSTMGRYGFIHGANPGRADTVPTRVKPQSYVIPADVVSGAGQGNSLAGAKFFDRMFQQGPYGTAPVKMPHAQRTPQPMPHFARGRGVDIKVSDGEYLVHPESVERVGEGDVEFGHKVVDNLVKMIRQKSIAHMATLPPPKGSDESMQSRGYATDGFVDDAQVNEDSRSMNAPNEQDYMDKSLLPPLPGQTGDLMDWIRAKNEAARGIGVTPNYAPRMLGIRLPRNNMAQNFAIGGGLDEGDVEGMEGNPELVQYRMPYREPEIPQPPPVGGYFTPSPYGKDFEDWGYNIDQRQSNIGSKYYNNLTEDLTQDDVDGMDKWAFKKRLNKERNEAGDYWYSDEQNPKDIIILRQKRDEKGNPVQGKEIVHYFGKNLRETDPTYRDHIKNFGKGENSNSMKWRRKD